MSTIYFTLRRFILILLIALGLSVAIVVTISARVDVTQLQPVPSRVHLSDNETLTKLAYTAFGSRLHVYRWVYWDGSRVQLSAGLLSLNARLQREVDFQSVLPDIENREIAQVRRIVDRAINREKQTRHGYAAVTIAVFERGFPLHWTSSTFIRPDSALNWTTSDVVIPIATSGPTIGHLPGQVFVPGRIYPGVFVANLMIYVVIIAAVNAVAIYFLRAVRARRGLCQKCGYDLRAGNLVCPECGYKARSSHIIRDAFEDVGQQAH